MEMEDLQKSLWHAFDVLDASSEVKKSRLRVLTNNLGHTIGVDQAETIWDKVSEEIIDFNKFFTVLSNNLLVGFGKTDDPKITTFKAELDNLCWMLCEKTYLQKLKKQAAVQELREFTVTDYFKLWKIFNFLCERSGDGILLFPLRTDIEEAERISLEICHTVGLPAPKIIPNRDSKTDTSFLLDFCQFITLVATRLGTDHPADVVSHGISEVHCQIVSDIVHKGFMVKFGNKLTTWKERWFVLTASALRYYASAEERDLKGSIVLCAECFTQSFPDKPGGKHHRFKLHTPNKQYEVAAPDLKSKNEWMSDIKRVVSQIGVNKESLQRLEWRERKKEREERRRRTAEEELRRCEEREKLLEREMQLQEERKQRQLAQEEIKERERLLELERQKREEEELRRQKETDELLEAKRLEIEAEKRRCAETEARLKEERDALMRSNMEALEAEREQRAKVEERLREEEAQLEEERRRLKELEETKIQLEQLVQQERSLKEDEEIVRNLQSKILEEEIAKREELERLQKEQRTQLKLEQLSRQELEEANQLQEETLAQAQHQLNSLIKDRQQADLQLQEAAEKLQKAELDRQVLEERIKLKEMNNSSRMARPLPQPDPNPFVTHRGLGAFSEAEFSKGTHSPDFDQMALSEEQERQLCDTTEAVDLNGDLSDEPEK